LNEDSSKDHHTLYINKKERMKIWCSDYMMYLPKMFGILTFLTLVGVALYDWRAILNLFKHLIAWVKLDPFKAGGVIVIVYIGLIVFSMPIVFFSIPLGFAFH